MLRFDISSLQRPRHRGKPFKLFSDELPVIDFEQQQLLQKLAERYDNKRYDLVSKRKPTGNEQDSHSLPAIGGPDWDLLSGSDHQSVKSESRLRALKPDLPQIHKRIRERLGLKENQTESLPNYYQRSIHRSENTRSMPKADEYKKFFQWPRLPSQQIVNQVDMQQNVLKHKDGHDAMIDSQDIKGKTGDISMLKDHHEYPKHKLKLDHVNLDLESKKLKAHRGKTKDVETQTPRNFPKSTHDILKSNVPESKDKKPIKSEETKNEKRHVSHQAVSILKKHKDTDLSLSTSNESVKGTNWPDTFKHITGTDSVNVLVHCDIPRKLLTSKHSVFNAYVGDILTTEQKSTRKVNFTETQDENKGSDQRKTDQFENSVLQMVETGNKEARTKQENPHPKLVSAYVLPRKEVDHTARKHILHDHTAKKRNLQNMMKHFRKIRGRQNMPSTINLNAKSKSLGVRLSEEILTGNSVKDKDKNSPFGHSEKSESTNSSPRANIDTSKPDTKHVSSRLDMSKSQSLNEDIETCVQIRKHHKILKRHKVIKHVKHDVQDADNETVNKEDDGLDNEIDRSMTGAELIKAYRLWNRRRKKYSGGLRTIEEPPTVVDYFSNMSHKKLNGFANMGLISESEDALPEND